MNIRDAMETGSSSMSQELEHQLFAFLGNGSYLAIIILAAMVLVVAVWSGWEMQRERRRQAAVKEELRALAVSDGSRPLALVIGPTSSARASETSTARNFTWRLRVRRWSLAVSLDRVENPV